MVDVLKKSLYVALKLPWILKVLSPLFPECFLDRAVWIAAEQHSVLRITVISVLLYRTPLVWVSLFLIPQNNLLTRSIESKHDLGSAFFSLKIKLKSVLLCFHFLQKNEKWDLDISVLNVSLKLKRDF